MISRLLMRILGTDNDRQLKRIRPLVEKINTHEPAIQALDDASLAAKTAQFREQIFAGKSLDDILPEAYAVVREVARRQLGQRHFDVQLVGGIVLHQGKIAEMKTGEGKTLTATLPLYLNALSGKGAHLITVNEYLASRDAEWMGQIFRFLGLEVACLKNAMSDTERKQAYAADILYATNNELGFDYLRDNMKFRLEDYVQRGLNFGIVDEVDSILIDEARTPLIISGSSHESSKLYGEVDEVIRRFSKGPDFEVDEKGRSAHFTEGAMDKLERAFGVKNLYAVENINLLHHATQALRAHAIFRRDVDYVVQDGEVMIVDDFTGRILPGRRYSDGLHQALEAKERVRVESESQTLASITLQNFFRLYPKLAGMTGTAATEAEEFHNIYKLDVVSIPTNVPVARDDKSDLIFLTQRAKFEAIVKDVRERHAKGQPVLIGTIAVETSEMLSAVLTKYGIPHEVLNAKQHAREADIVAHAGEPGHVTIATNMAGRGTDIKLTAESKLAGGLYILGTERHESRRIDNQLRGRSGRQGDPGESRFYISLEDDLIRRFAGETLKRNMERFGMAEDEIIESRFVSKRIEFAQEKVEKQNFDVRRHLLEYDDVLNQQRTVIYSYRHDVLRGAHEIHEIIRDQIVKVVQGMVRPQLEGHKIDSLMQEELISQFHRLTQIPADEFKQARLSAESIEQFETDLITFLLKRYEQFRAAQHAEMIQSAEKWLMLETIDQAWKQHMLNLDNLKEGIGLRGWGQKTPLVEYKREAFVLFKDVMEEISRDVVSRLFQLNLERFDEHALEEKRERELEELNLIGAGDGSEQTAEQAARDESRVGRNDPCSCGSGKKYKKCCG